MRKIEFRYWTGLNMFFATGNECYIRAESFKNCSVIGNIYENKELLEEE